ncbi:MAG: sigma 54-interacting transcriptional regulator [Deltaproteobacteria bacterium]|nr:sigma 54-interacting transcriptional regulator [Deltaproteobacteria bacterium]
MSRSPTNAPPVIIGSSQALKAVLRDAKRLAAADLAVLITGETGTGKELLARQIHIWAKPAAPAGPDEPKAPPSDRRELAKQGREDATNADDDPRPFVAFNCAAVPENLIESELFGFEPGAFSGAARKHRGLFMQADGGTLFLDEVGDLSLATQAKLLRALQEGEIRPLGTERIVRVRVRLLAATHKDLAEEVAAGRFREDLFYRLNASMPLCLPPLRDRRSDILAMVNFALNGATARKRERATSRDRNRRHLKRDALSLLMTYAWPGNVRQLLQAVKNAAALCRGKAISRAAIARALGMADPRNEERGDVTAAALAELTERGALAAARLRDVTGCARKEGHAVLRELQRRGNIARRGQGRSTYYVTAGERVLPKPNPPAPTPAPTVTPPPPAVVPDLNSRQAELVATLPVGERVTTGEYGRRFGVGRATAFRDLDALAEANVLAAVGKGRGGAHVRRPAG